MLRRILIVTMCLAVAFMGVSGAHVHLADAHEPGHGAELHDHAHAVTIMDVDHDAEHAQHGDIDVEPMAKSFGKLSPNPVLAAIVLLYVLITLFSGSAGTLMLRAPPGRPPKRRRIFYLLPPSHGPPTAALPR